MQKTRRDPTSSHAGCRSTLDEMESVCSSMSKKCGRTVEPATAPETAHRQLNLNVHCGFPAHSSACNESQGRGLAANHVVMAVIVIVLLVPGGALAVTGIRSIEVAMFEGLEACHFEPGAESENRLWVLDFEPLCSVFWVPFQLTNGSPAFKTMASRRRAK